MPCGVNSIVIHELVQPVGCQRESSVPRTVSSLAGSVVPEVDPLVHTAGLLVSAGGLLVHRDNPTVRPGGLLVGAGGA